MSTAETFKDYTPAQAYSAALRHLRKVNEEIGGIAWCKRIVTERAAPVMAYRFQFEDGSVMDVGDNYGPFVR